MFGKIYLQTMMDPAFIQRILTNLEFLSLKEDDTILDCGCGNGVYIDIISEKCNCRIIGIDIARWLVPLLCVEVGW
jgi:cyclopropane fatty-acyl-phospholipid synthase-like methyltransferase